MKSLSAMVPTLAPLVLLATGLLAAAADLSEASSARAAATNSVPIDSGATNPPSATNVLAGTNMVVTTNAVGITNATAAAETTNATAKTAGDTAPVTAAASEPSKGPVVLAFDSFKIISQRNIFDPARRPSLDGRPRPRLSATPARVEAFGLYGTLVSPQGAIAFFDGSDAKYRKVLRAPASIGDCKLLAVTPKSVKLESDGRQVDLPVGSQMRLQEDGKWELRIAAGAIERPGGSSASTDQSAAGSGDDTTSSDPAVNDVLKRLMQQREKELGK